jgi:hypothetical protein
MNAFVNDGYPRPQFRYKKDCVIKGRPHKGFTPLQAADILAWFLYRAQKEWARMPQTHRTRDEAVRLSRLPFRELENLPEAPRKITQDNLDEYVASRAYLETRQQLLATQESSPVRYDRL